jgi:hypothetical protein
MRAARIAAQGGALLVLAVALSSCGDGDAAKPAPPASELAALAASAETFAGRAEQFIQRPWASRLEFPKRLHLRVQTNRSFVQEATAAASKPTSPQEGLIQRGRALVADNKPFDEALSLIERTANSLDQITGFDRVIELHMPPLESRGEAPFRIRLTNLRNQATLGFKHFDEALARTLDKSPDAQIHEKIAQAALREALETSAKLTEEVKKSAALAHNAIDRERMLRGRIEWAGGIAEKLGAALPEEGSKALAEARAFATTTLKDESLAVLDALRNAQPDAAQKAEDLGRRTDAVIERLTRAFLDLARKTGAGDPK